MSEDTSWIKRALHRTSMKAEDYINNPTKVQRLLQDVQKKTRTINLDGSPFGALASQGGVLWRMLRAWQKGEYRVAPRGVLISAIAALIYFVMPWDVIPDFIAGLGLTDDAMLLAFVLRSIRSDIDKFNTWELTKKGRKAAIVDGEVVYVAPEAAEESVTIEIEPADAEPVTIEIEPATEETVIREPADAIPVENEVAEDDAKRPWWHVRQRRK